MIRPTRTTRTLLAVMTIAAFYAAAADRAAAACFATPTGARLVPQRAPASPKTLSPTILTIADAGQATPTPVVGLWDAVYLVGDGPDRFDEAFQQFHSDGTEMMLSNGVPPALGNVCVGIWKQTGPRTVKVKHTTWNWDANGTFFGTFILEVTLRVSVDGHAYTGTWLADSYDLAGALIPTMHFEGVVHGRRITIE